MTLTDDTFYELVGNERRRASLERLAEAETEWHVSDLASAVATDIADSSTSPDDIYDSVYISLCQNHLPKLADVSLVRYNDDDKTVTQGPEFRDIADRLQSSQPAATQESVRVKTIAMSALTVVLGGPAVIVSSTVSLSLLAFLLVFHLTVILLLVAHGFGVGPADG